MNTYIGTKILQAIPMSRKEYNNERGWQLPANENGDDPGFLVVYPDSASNTDKFQGYVSWSPKEQFEAAYIDLGNVGHFPAFHQRLIGEWAQLKTNVEKLGSFIKSPGFFALSFPQRSKLEDQLRAMDWYKSILDWRVKSLKP